MPGRLKRLEDDFTRKDNQKKNGKPDDRPFSERDRQARLRDARYKRRQALTEQALPDLKDAVKRAKRLKRRKEQILYIENFGRAKRPKILKETDKWKSVCEAFLKNDPEGGTKALFLDFDGTMARFTGTPEETHAVHGFLSAVKTFVDKGYKVAVITGRPIDGEKGILKALKRSGATTKLINRLDIFGSHGIQHRGRETGWKVQIPPEIAAKIVPYEQPQKDLLDHLQQRIDTDDALKDSGIFIERKVSGATIHYKGVAEDRRKDIEAKLGELLSTLVPLADDNRNFTNMQDQKYKDFTYNGATESYEIRLNPAETGIVLNKGTAVKTLAERWGLKVAIAFGDDTTDLHMQTKLQELVDDESSPLTTQAFVGVKHSKTPEKIRTDSSMVVEGQESAVGLLAQIARDAEYQTIAPVT
ncbi:MAG TPA: HAD hydrolase family protein [Ktedonobacteraceae bacterium]|nr:HAD hydrolase family protein [Ktedonobacteraceae bacterium]